MEGRMIYAVVVILVVIILACVLLAGLFIAASSEFDDYEDFE